VSSKVMPGSNAKASPYLLLLSSTLPSYLPKHTDHGVVADVTIVHYTTKKLGFFDCFRPCPHFKFSSDTSITA